MVPVELISDGSKIGDGEVGIGRRVSGSVPCPRRDVSYAIVVSTNWRKMMRKSRARSCSLDGT